MTFSVSQLLRYPLKSARGEALAATVTDRFGIAGDRRWMLVDEAGQFVSQRQLPALCRLQAQSQGGGLTLSWEGASVEVELPAVGADLLQVAVWSDRLSARLVPAAVSAWLSDCLGQALRLVHMPDDAQRRVDADFASRGETVSFADGFPLLIIGQSSLDDLNGRLENPVPMDRFRPNLVIAGAEAFAEDRWQRLRIGDTELSLVKPCSRCVIPSIDQATGERDRAINRVLADYRRCAGVIYFGVNALVPPGASLHVGQGVQVLP